MSKLKPNAYYDGICSIDMDILKLLNIRGLIIDVDNTLIDKNRFLSDDIVQWVEKAKARGFKVVILSNSNKIDKIEPVSKKLGVDYVGFAKKPGKAGFLRAVNKLGLPAGNIAMIGDQVFTDVWGANRVGLFSIYVKPLSKEDYWYTAWKRPIEALILKHFGY